MQQDRIVFVTIAVLIVVLVIAGTISSSKKISSVNAGTRAVIVPTADAVRTVVVPPCGTGTDLRSANVAVITNTVGTTSVELPQGPGERVVLVPKCGAGQGGSAGTTNLPSAEFVLRPGATLPSVGAGANASASSASSSQVAGPQAAQLQLTVPNGSPIRTIIVGACEKAQVSGPAEQVLSAANRSTTAVAPPC